LGNHVAGATGCSVVPVTPSVTEGISAIRSSAEAEASPLSVPLRALHPGPLRVLQVVARLGMGGMEHNIFKLASGMQKSEFEQALCALRGMDAQVAWLRNFSGKVFFAGETDSGLQFAVFRLATIMKQYRPHIVHSRNWGAIEAVPAARLAKVPVVIHSEHGYELDMLAGLPLRRRLLRRAFYGMADALFTVSDELCHYHGRQAGIPPERFRVIRNGVDTEHFASRPAERDRLRQRLGFADKDLVIGCVGRVVRIKDLPTLFRAAEILVKRAVTVRLLLVGSGPELPACERQVAASPELAGRVQFLGACNNVSDLLQAMDIFVLTSICEGMSNTLLEAMASGLPLVATRVGGNPEVLEDGHCGWLFPPGDPVKLAELLLLLADSRELRQQFGMAARQRAIAEFSLERMLESYRDLYLELAAKRGLLTRTGSDAGVRN
jgi:sugar transferase (PEP-CTERM/EpsH1 system associated)